ncbi:MAG: hypothetical protein EOS71_27760 [Mesorhizobium sp.]|nr:MAG: hypothetical protein EOS71_27760 [Mesorhizobium sp.]
MSGKKERKTINSEVACEAGYFARKCGLTRDEAIRIMVTASEAHPAAKPGKRLKAKTHASIGV